MSSATEESPPSGAPATGGAPTTVPAGPGPLGRLGLWVISHGKLVAIAWIAIVVGLGVFAPFVEKNLSGAGWQANGSESVQARELAQQHFGGNASSALQVVVSSSAGRLDEGDGPRVLAAVTDTLRADHRISEVIAPQPGATLSADGRTAIVIGGAGADPNDMVRAATELKGRLHDLSTSTVAVNPTGASVLWSDFNAANLDAMMTSEMISWPITLGILVIAFGALVAAGLPLLLTIAGLVASAGSLVLINEIVPTSIWAMNFAMMFSLALGIDYALFLVVRYRAARFGQELSRERAIAQTMDTAGKAVLLSGITVMISLSAVMIIPSPSFRSVSGGIVLSVIFVLGATLTLLPLVLFKLDAKINRIALPWATFDTHRSPVFERWGERLWRRPAVWGAGALLVLVALALPIAGLKTAMPSIAVLPDDASARIGYAEVQRAFGAGAPGTLQIVVPTDHAGAAAAALRTDPGIAGAMPAVPATDGSGLSMIQAVPTVGPSDPELSATVDRLRSALPDDARLGGAAVENLDLKHQLDTYTPIVLGIILVLGFALLLVAVRAPLIAALGTAVSLLSTAAAFGVARLVFQEGHGSGLLGFEPQGFLDAWAPVFFFAMIFAIAMDYTVFLLSSAKEHWERSGDAREAAVGAVAHSGRVIFAAGGVMVAVFFTFALSGPLPPKEMGVILGVAVLLDTFLVRLVLLPVGLRLAGRKAWAIPSWLDRILPRISFAHD
ncbi:MMPL family transporter [Tsukamurella spumae]|uniref:MMPL family transporter n=1 Tax=Tsukamurella spumae TaxID=44753 RepID=A0A846WZY0_9ACTN|nr:MMPL family transporter [Tsukamurella spumae]NKY17270.1 MMPL family transporter [Tsukamurella spumae]